MLLLQSHRFSRFSSSSSCHPLHKNDPPQKGYVISLTTSRIQQKKKFRWLSQKTVISANNSTRCNSSSNNNLSKYRNNKLVARTCFDAVENGFVLQPPQGGDDDDGGNENSSVATLSHSNNIIWIRQQFYAFYRFIRPHTVFGTIIGITSVSLLPLTSIADLSPAFVVGLLKAMIPAIFMNIYVVGLNQLFDVEIDKVNKPNLPLASGEYSMGFGKAIVSAFGLMSFAMGITFQSPAVLAALFICFLFGSVYSVELPMLRWKRNAFLAASCIMIVRAITLQLAFSYHIQTYVLGRAMVFTKSLAFSILCMSLFTAVIALFKDIPDVDGDRDFGIQSFSVRLGKKRVFWVCISMLLLAYGGAVVIGASSSCFPNNLITVLGHCTLASILWYRSHSIDLSDNASITAFYIFIWKLFYTEYLLLPFVR